MVDMTTFNETLHPRGQATNAGQFREKSNDAPTTALRTDGASGDPRTWALEDIGLGVVGERFALAAAVSGESFTVETDEDHHDQAIATVYAIARLRDVHIEAPHHSVSVAQMIASGRSPIWNQRPQRSDGGTLVQELGLGKARVTVEGDGAHRAYDRDGELLGEFDSADDAQVAVSRSVMEPGVIARANDGILLLDNATEFSAVVLDSLRQPMETGQIVVSRAAVTKTFDARVQVAMIAYPCLCAGNTSRCKCSPVEKRRHLSRLSGPIRDRAPATFRSTDIPTQADGSLTESQARKKVAAARAAEASSAALREAAGRGGATLADLSDAQVREMTRQSTGPGAKRLDEAIQHGQITLRRYDKAARRAWSLAFLDGLDAPNDGHVYEALLHVS